MTDRIEQLQQMLSQEPEDTFCLYSLGQEYAKAGDYENAIEYFDRTLQADPTYCYAYYHKAKCQDESGDEAAARATLEAGLQQARAAGDVKAEGEIGGYLDALT